MRNGQNKRMRGRNRKGTNPLTRVYESNGPDVKIRGTAHHVAEKYLQLARDAQGSGDPVAAENYYQHAEHYFRLIAAAQEQFRQHQPFGARPDMDMRDDSMDDMEDDGPSFGGEPGYGAASYQQPQQHQPREQNFQPREHREHREGRDNRERNDRNDRDRNDRERHDRDGQNRQPPPPQNFAPAEAGDIERLPSFITGGNAPANGGEAAASGERAPREGGRFPLHRRRRRHNGPREGASGEDMPAGPQGE